MALKTSHKWIIGIVAIIALLVAIYFLYKSTSKGNAAGVPPTSTTTSNPGIAALVAQYFGGAGSWLANAFGGNPKTTNNSGYTTVGNCVDGCDDGSPGKDCNGFLSSQC